MTPIPGTAPDAAPPAPPPPLPQVPPAVLPPAFAFPLAPPLPFKFDGALPPRPVRVPKIDEPPCFANKSEPEYVVL